METTWQRGSIWKWFWCEAKTETLLVCVISSICKLIYLPIWSIFYLETFVAFSDEKSKEKRNV